MDYTGSTSTVPRKAEPRGYTASYPPEELKTEFQRKYPPDPFGEEMEASARVWKVFKDEATNHDKTLLAGWNKTLDILLIFAGLFSAVATAFVIESYKLLQPDYEEYIATALFVAFSARNASGALPDSTLDLRNPADFAPGRTSRWLNGIWFTSLVLSLVVAFLCILLKQWLEEYNGRISAPFPSVRQWARRRTYYFEGLTNWGVPMFIALLPLLLHAALFLFLGGLSLLLWSLDSVSAAWIVTLTVCLFVFYTVSNMLPFVRPDCPSSTPMIHFLQAPFRIVTMHVLICFTSLVVSSSVDHRCNDSDTIQDLSATQRYLKGLLRASSRAYRRVAIFTASTISTVIPSRVRQKMTTIYWRLHHRFATRNSAIDASLPPRDFTDREQEDLEAHAIRWLVTSHSTPEVVVVGFQAIAASYPWSSAAQVMRTVDGLQELITQSLNAVYLDGRNVEALTPADVARSFRSATCLFDHDEAATLAMCVARGAYWNALAIPHYDLPLMADIVNFHHEDAKTSISRIQSRLANCSPVFVHPDCRPHFLLSTAMQVLHSGKIPLSTWLQLCRTLPFSDIPIRDFVRLIMSLLHYRDLDVCPLIRLHRGRACGRQCGYEIISEIVNSRRSLQLSERDARTGLDILILHCKTAHPKEDWLPLEHSNLLVLLGSDIFLSHDQPYFGIALSGIVRELHDAARALKRPRGLPPWTPEWGRAISGILAVADRMHRNDTVGSDISYRISWALQTMYNVIDPEPHVDILPTDNMDRLPLVLLGGSPISAWSLLVSLPRLEDHEFHIDRLANHLAVCLCIAWRKGINVDKEFQDFVTSSHILTRLHELPVTQDYSNPKLRRFVTLVQHCNEIRSGWLLDLALTSGQEGSDFEHAPRLRSTINAVELLATGLGRCRMCPTEPVTGRRRRFAVPEPEGGSTI